MKYPRLSRLYKYFFYLNSKKSKIVYTREKLNENHKFLDFKKNLTQGLVKVLFRYLKIIYNHRGKQTIWLLRRT